jgi:hypothetical protein
MRRSRGARAARETEELNNPRARWWAPVAEEVVGRVPSVGGGQECKEEQPWEVGDSIRAPLLRSTSVVSSHLEFLATALPPSLAQ